MSDFRYILEKTTKKTACLECGKRTFVRYVDTSTKDHLPEQYGRCDREVNCAYWLSPYKDGYSKMIFDQERTGGNAGFNLVKYEQKPKPEQKPASLIDRTILSKSLSAYEVNNFTNYLLTLFPIEIVEVLISKYLIGTSKNWEGSTVFWQVDTTGNIKGGKIMLYSSATGKRVKQPYNHITWVHSALKFKDYNLKQCLFGAHLLTEDNKATPCAIVESEKSAIIASAYLPDFIWLACGSLSNLTEEKCKDLTGRNVFLFPDLNCFDRWSERAKALSNITQFEVSDLLEKNANEDEKEKGLDLADYLIRFEYQEFSQSENLTKPNIENLTKLNIQIDGEVNSLKPMLNKPLELWDIESLESFFNSIDIPGHPIKINEFERIENVELFIKAHLTTIKANNGNRTFRPYLDRLQTLKQVLSFN